MTFEEAVADLDARVRWGIRPGLERVAALMEALDHPERSYPVLHVAGTNGKYSVAVLISTILEGLGMNVGTYSSPHLERITDRIVVGGREIAPDEFGGVLGYLKPYIELVEAERGDHLTYFETVTAIALEWFFDSAVHAAVLETGLGGEYDATNVADARVAVVTRVTKDHLQQFGDLENAAWEKAGVIKEGSAVVTGVEDPALLGIIEGRARERGVDEIVRLGRELVVEDLRLAVGGQMMTIRTTRGAYRDLVVPVFGAHQAGNVALAVGACEAFTGGPLERDTLRAALAEARIPGRLELMGRRPLMLVDGGHNPDAATAVVEGVRSSFTYGRGVCVLGMLGDKLTDEVLEILAPAFEVFVVTAPADDRAADPEELVRGLVAEGVGEERIVRGGTVPEAVMRALDLAAPDDLILVFGSFYVAGEARSWLRAEGFGPQA